MADIDIEILTNIEGLDELEEALTQGSKRTARTFLQRVENRAANILVRSAEDNAPYAEGDLADNIHKQTIINSDGMTIRVGPGKETFWGLIQEFGAPEANVPALHWLENSAREVQDEVLGEYVEAVNDGLEDMKGGK